LKPTKNGKIKYFLKKKNEGKGDQKTNSKILRILGIAQFISLVYCIISYGAYGFILYIFLVFTVAFISISVLFALFLNLHKFILYGVIGTVFDISSKIIQLIKSFSGNYEHFGFTTVLSLFFFGTIIFLSIFLMKNIKYEEEARIRKEILVLGTKYTDFKVKKVSKNCSSDKNTIIKIAKKMVKNKEIYADYFKISKKFVFNNKANTEEIDKLMEIFSEWETEHIGKKA
jgi:hypothetical protein